MYLRSLMLGVTQAQPNAGARAVASGLRVSLLLSGILSPGTMT